MSVVGTLAVRIKGDDAHLEKTLTKSNVNLKKFAKNAATAVAAATAVFAVFSKRTIDSFDRLAKLSVQAGVTTESLSALGYAAELSGMNTEQLATNMGRLTKGMNDASQGIGEAKKAFDTLGIDGGSIDTADEALMQIADRFAEMPDGAKKTATAMQLFGRSGMQMIPFLNQGRDGLEAMRKEAERFGIVLDTDTGKAAEQFNDNLTRLQAIGQGVFYSMANDWLPVINDFANGFLDAAAATDSFYSSLSAAILTDTSGDVGELTARSTELRKELENLKKQAEETTFMPEALQSSIKITEAQIAMIEARIRKLQEPKTLAGVSVEAPFPTTEFSSPEVAKFTEEMKTEVDDYSEFIEQITGRADRARLEQQEMWLHSARSIGDISKQEYEDAIRSLRNVEDEMTQFAISAARNIQGILGDGIYDMLSGKFDDIGDSFLDMLNRMVADLMSSQISQLLFGNFGNSNQIGGIVGQVAGAVAGSFTSGLSGISSAGTAVPSSYGSVGASGSFGGLSEGGYTGDGGQYEPAGVVHRGEYVLKAAATRRIGKHNLDRMNNGYANGGYVGSSSGAPNVNVNIKNEAGADGYKATAQARQNSDGGLNIDVMVRKVVSSDIQNNGQLAQQMANTFGLRRAI